MNTQEVQKKENRETVFGTKIVPCRSEARLTKIPTVQRAY